MNLLFAHSIMLYMFLNKSQSFCIKRNNFNKNFKLFISSLDYQYDNKIATNMFYTNNDLYVNVNKFLFPITSPKFNRLQPKLIRDFQYKLFFDGFAQNANGIAGSSAIIFKNNNELWRNKRFVGKNNTNTVAQYKGLISGLKAASEFNIKTILVKSDSEIINHLNNKVDFDKVKLLEFYDFYKQAKLLEKKFDTVEYINIDKDLNNQAHNLANEAVNEYLSYTNEN